MQAGGLLRQHTHAISHYLILRERSSQVCLHLQGMQNECDMVPLMMQSNFKAKGWLGLILGTRLWCKSFCHGVTTCVVTLTAT